MELKTYQYFSINNTVCLLGSSCVPIEVSTLAAASKEMRETKETFT